MTTIERAAILGKYSLVDLVLKAGALGVALVAAGFLGYGVMVLYEDNKAKDTRLFELVNKTNESNAAVVRALDNNTEALRVIAYRSSGLSSSP